VAQVPKITKAGLALRTRQSTRVKGIFWSGPSKPGPIIHINLTEGDSASHVGTSTKGGATTRGGPVIRGVPTTRCGPTTDAISKMKGKHVVATVEKGIEIVEAKRRMKPDWKR